MANVSDRAAHKFPTPKGSSSGVWLIVNFAITTALSAFLLFQVQPLISKFILPWFGGSPAVWSTCMLFFQLVLFAGYLYAFGVIRYLAPGKQTLVHATLLVVAACLWQIAPSEAWKPAADDNPTWRILCLLGTTVGLPYFAPSSTGPLLQAWFSRAFPGRSPYRLYALSNAGSLLALVTYPFLIEPAWDLTTQARMWSWGFLAFVVACAAVTFISAAWNRRLSAQGLPGAPEIVPAAVAGEMVHETLDGGPTNWGRRALWLLLPAWASLLLLATTNQICENIAVIPFMWVAPLSLYLLTFIICFDHPRWYHRPSAALGALVFLLMIAGSSGIEDYLKEHFEHSLSTPETLSIYLGGMFLACFICHGELVRLKPAPRHLTEFYLCISAGGALGGIFVSLIAPLIFRTLFEWQIALYGATALSGFVAVLAWVPQPTALLVGGCAALVAGAAAYHLDGGGAWSSKPLEACRNFYGAILVRKVEEEDPPKKYLSLWHGSVLHGRQYLEPAELVRKPITYYSPDSGVGRAITFYQSRPDNHVGVIGLGAGTIATYGRAGDRYRIYEINPEVERLTKKYFSFIRDSPAKVDVILGDARLSMEREPPQQFDVLAIDAFSGDSIPMHLLTTEAVEIYLRHLKPDGVLAMHITNHYIDLAPVTQGLARHFDLGITEIFREPDPDNLITRSQWVLMTRNQELLAKNPPQPLERPWPSPDPPIWTDQHSNLFKSLRHGEK